MPRGASKKPSDRSTLTPAAWVDAATEVLLDQGIDHVRVDALAIDLGVTRGSFYWHFRDREDLLKAVLAAWRDRATEQLTARLMRVSGDPGAQLHDVLSLPFRGRAAVRAARIELAIRAWARRDASARKAVDEADASRIAYHTKVLGAMGFSDSEAQMRAFLAYSYEVAESVLQNQGSHAQRSARTAFVERLLRQALANE